jgi:hypothetical protein
LTAQDRDLAMAAPLLMPARELADAIAVLGPLRLVESESRTLATTLGRLYPGEDGTLWSPPGPDRLADTHLLTLAAAAPSDADGATLLVSLCAHDDPEIAAQPAWVLSRCLSTPGAADHYSTGVRRV